LKPFFIAAGRGTFRKNKQNYEYKVPSAVTGRYEDLALLISFLASGEARHLNGADIRLDGGFLLHYMDHKMKRPK